VKVAYPAVALIDILLSQHADWRAFSSAHRTQEPDVTAPMTIVLTGRFYCIDIKREATQVSSSGAAITEIGVSQSLHME